MRDAADRVGFSGAPRSAADRVQRHSALVRHLRLAVPALAAGLLVTYALSATPPRIDKAFVAQFQAYDPATGSVTLDQPRYSGQDLSGQPFEVAAQSATRAEDSSDLVGLDRPEARRVGTDGKAVLVRAERGLYDQEGRTMDLTENVELEQESSAEEGFILKTDAARVDLENQIIRSAAEVTGEGEKGSVRADRGSLYQNEDRLVLEGNVKIILSPTVPKDPPGDDPESEE